MSNQSPFGRANAAFPSLPRGDVLGTFATYPEAQSVVARLAESDFPVKQLSIVGNDLKTVERVTGKLTYGRAAIAGALSGLWLGIFFGIVLTLFSRGATGGTIIAAAVIGAAFGMLYGVVSFSITKRQRDFTSLHQVLATNYQIIVDPQLTAEAQRILGTAPTGWGAQARPNVPPQANVPPQWGPSQPGTGQPQGERRPESAPRDQTPYGERTDRPQYGEKAPITPPAPGTPDERGDQPPYPPA